MRALTTLLLIGSLTAPAFADRCYRSYRGGHGFHYNRYQSGHFAPRVRSYGYRHRSYPVRSWHLAHYAHAGQGYGYGCGGYGYGYGYAQYRLGYADAWIKYHGKAYQLAPVIHRFTTVLTLEDEVFDGLPARAPAKDADGAPHARTKPVGARFLTN